MYHCLLVEGVIARTSTLDLLWVQIGLSEVTKRDVWSLHDMNALGLRFIVEIVGN